MDLEKTIIQILIEYQFGDNLKNGDYITGVKKMYFGEVAATVVKKLNLHDVVQQREPFKAFLRVLEEVDNDNATITDEDAFIDEFLKSL